MRKGTRDNDARLSLARRQVKSPRPAGAARHRFSGHCSLARDKRAQVGIRGPVAVSRWIRSSEGGCDPRGVQGCMLGASCSRGLCSDAPLSFLWQCFCVYIAAAPSPRARPSVAQRWLLQRIFAVANTSGQHAQPRESIGAEPVRQHEQCFAPQVAHALGLACSAHPLHINESGPASSHSARAFSTCALLRSSG